MGASGRCVHKWVLQGPWVACMIRSHGCPRGRHELAISSGAMAGPGRVQSMGGTARMQGCKPWTSEGDCCSEAMGSVACVEGR